MNSVLKRNIAWEMDSFRGRIPASLEASFIQNGSFADLDKIAVSSDDEGRFLRPHPRQDCSHLRYARELAGADQVEHPVE
jgi:hypothetical protein